MKSTEVTFAIMIRCGRPIPLQGFAKVGQRGQPGGPGYLPLALQYGACGHVEPAQAHHFVPCPSIVPSPRTVTLTVFHEKTKGWCITV